MKAKVSRGGGFRGALNYVLDVGEEATHDKEVEWVAGNMTGRDPRELSAEFAAVRQLRPDIQRPVWHCSLSLPEGERLEVERWGEVADVFMQKMGFDSPLTPYIAVRHSDTDYDHIHIIASRIDLAGKVWLGQWEARKAITATQALEREFGLTLTPGLGDARAERKRLTDKEINMALRKEQANRAALGHGEAAPYVSVEPPRQKLQRLVNEALQGAPNAPAFADRLTAAGVSVRANLASTGRMNGFSFLMDGVAFKGSDLGKAYTWKGLQERGLSYEQTRDRAALQRYRAVAPDRASGSELAADRGAAAPELGPVTERDRERDGRGPAVAGELTAGRAAGPGELRPDYCAATPEPGRAGDGADPAGDRPGERGYQPLEPERQSPPNRDPERDDERRTDAAVAWGTTERSQPLAGMDQALAGGDAAAVAEAGKQLPGGRARQSDYPRDAAVDWKARFQLASAARRRECEAAPSRGSERQVATAARPSPAQNQGLDRAMVGTARTVEPTGYLEAQGYTVRCEGRHLSVRSGSDEYYRITQKPDGHWVACDKYGNGIGDNIALVQEIEPGTRFTEAVYKLHGESAFKPPQKPLEPRYKTPTLPPLADADRRVGRRYVAQRGISAITLDYAEQTGFVRYTGGGVLFCGYDPNGQVRNITKRSIDPQAEVQKRDLWGSDKRYPPILEGGPSKVWIVEGGVDALAVRDLAIRRGKEPPTVLVSGGAKVRGFLERPEIQGLLRQAERVTVARDNEAAPEKQRETDAAHNKQMEAIRQIRGECHDWRPPPGVKDVAELNWRELGQTRERQLQLERKLERSKDRGPDLSM
jgi:hypothetical protein